MQLFSQMQEHNTNWEAMGQKYDRQFKIVFDAIKQLKADDKNQKERSAFNCHHTKVSSYDTIRRLTIDG